MKRLALVTLLLVALGFVVISSQTAHAFTEKDGVYTLTVSTCWTPSINLIEADYHMCEIVEEMSGGRLVIDFKPAGSVVPLTELFDAVEAGTLDGASDYPGYWIGKEPAFEFFFAFPMGMMAHDMELWLYHGGGLELVQELYGKYNMMYFPVGRAGMESGLRGNEPIRTIEDFKGLKCRFGNRAAAYVASKLGAKPVSIAGSEIYNALERNILDAAEFSMPSTDWKMGFQEVTKYWCLPGWHQTMWGGGWSINMDTWNALPDDLKSIFKIAARETGIWSFAKWEADSVPAVDNFLESGIEVTRLDQETIDAIYKYANEYVEMQSEKDPMFKKVAESYFDWLKKYSTWREMELWSGYGFGHNRTAWPNLD